MYNGAGLLGRDAIPCDDIKFTIALFEHESKYNGASVLGRVQ